MRTKLEFKDKTSAECEVLGSVEYNGKRYAVFLDNDTRDLFIYKYKKKKPNKYVLAEVKDRKEFRGVCMQLNDLVKERDDV